MSEGDMTLTAWGRENLAWFLFEKFANPPGEWRDAPEARKEVWRRYADEALRAASEID